MTKFMTVLAAVVAIGMATTAMATQPTTAEPAKPAQVAAPTVAPTAPAVPTTAQATATAPAPTTTTTPPAAKTTTPETAGQWSTFAGQITSLTPTTCKIKDVTGMEKTFNLGTLKTEGWKVGDKVEAKYDPKTNNLVSVSKK